MRAKYLGKTEFLVLTNGKVYEVLSVERDWYRIVDDSGEDYLYPPELFELVHEREAKTVEETGQWECPFYHRVVGEDECYDLHLVAMRMFEAPEIVREEDCG